MNPTKTGRQEFSVTPTVLDPNALSWELEEKRDSRCATLPLKMSKAKEEVLFEAPSQILRQEDNAKIVLVYSYHSLPSRKRGRERK